MSDRKLVEGKLVHDETSPTAATVGKRLYGPSGAMDYRVILATAGGAKQAATVNAATGDDAAAKALEKFPGWKVALVTPASSPEIRVTDDLVGTD